MRLASWSYNGAIYHGTVTESTVVELGTGDLSAYLESAGTPRRELPIDDVTLCAPLTRPGKLLAVAANYQAHVTEGGGPSLDRSRLSPRLFLKPPTSIVGPGDPIAMPTVSTQVDWEAELGVVIGRRTRNVGVGDALGAVFGYLTSNDVSARSMDYGYERDTDDKAVWFFDWLAGKWLDGFAPLGPYLVTADEVPDPQALRITCDVNGVRRQDGSTKDMIFSVAELVSFASTLMTLEPGDVILTGTPSGVGAATGDFLAAGDVIDITVEGLGTLSNRIVSMEEAGSGSL